MSVYSTTKTLGKVAAPRDIMPRAAMVPLPHPNPTFQKVKHPSMFNATCDVNMKIMEEAFVEARNCNHISVDPVTKVVKKHCGAGCHCLPNIQQMRP
jgi:hypothetical protein